MTLETRNAKREEAIRSLQKIPVLAVKVKEAEWPEERAFWVSRMEYEQANVRRIAEELSCE